MAFWTPIKDEEIGPYERNEFAGKAFGVARGRDHWLDHWSGKLIRSSAKTLKRQKEEITGELVWK